MPFLHVTHRRQPRRASTPSHRSSRPPSTGPAARQDLHTLKVLSRRTRGTPPASIIGAHVAVFGWTRKQVVRVGSIGPSSFFLVAGHAHACRTRAVRGMNSHVWLRSCGAPKPICRLAPFPRLRWGWSTCAHRKNQMARTRSSCDVIRLDTRDTATHMTWS